MKTVALVSFISFVFFSISGFCQNLVLNPGFEEFIKGAKTNFSSGILMHTNHWKGAEENSNPNYFHKELRSVPSNCDGYQNPHSGNAYSNLTIYKSGSASLQSRLDKKMIKDSLYYAGFYISLCDSSQFSVKKIGLLISDFFPEKKMSQYKPQIENDSSNKLNDSDNWLLISGLYKAKGNEQVITIGAFSENNELINLNKKRYWNYISAQYYIDDVFVIPVRDTSEVKLGK